MLQAAHIRSYKGKHTDDPRNGLLLRADIHQLFDARRLKLKVPPYSKDGETAPIQVELDDELQKDESLRNLHKKSLIHPALQDPITRGLLAKVSEGGEW